MSEYSIQAMPGFSLYLFGPDGKLVRDSIPEVMESQGHIPIKRVVPNPSDEYDKYLRSKIIEEMAETKSMLTPSEAADIRSLMDACWNRPDMYADLLEFYENTVVINADFSEADEIYAHEQKMDRLGSFLGGVVVLGVQVPDNDSFWINYYNSEPDRFIRFGQGGET